MSEQRASDGDRERAAEHLRRAAGEGRLTVDELGDRVQHAYEARTRGELARLLDDVGDERAPAVRRAGTGGMVVRPGEGGARWVVAIMGSVTRAGRWRVSPRLVVLNLMGGSDLDFNDAELADDSVDVTVLSLMGGGNVRVPEGLRVEVSDIAIMGGNDVKRGRPEDEHHDGPLLRLRLISIMGGTNVRRGRRRSRAERRAEREGLRPPSS